MSAPGTVVGADTLIDMTAVWGRLFANALTDADFTLLVAIGELPPGHTPTDFVSSALFQRGLTITPAHPT